MAIFTNDYNPVILAREVNNQEQIIYPVTDSSLVKYNDDGDVNNVISTHIEDNDIHVSIDEKNIWNNNIRVGTKSIEIPMSRWCSVVYGNNIYVAVSYNSEDIAIYSKDGINWKQTIMFSTNNKYLSITYGDDKFVAVGIDTYASDDIAVGIIVYSEDGINWQDAVTPSGGTFYAITYGNGKFVSVKYNSIYVICSEDGINWTISTLPVTDAQNWLCVCYGDGKFVTVSTIGNGACSEDGIKWIGSTLPVIDESSQWVSVCYGNGKFVAVALNSNMAAYSYDGINWTQTNMPASTYWMSVTYGDGKFVAIAGHNNNIAAYSYDGINWVQTTLPVSANWYSVCYGDGKFVAVTYSNGTTYTDHVAAYSVDGINWIGEYKALVTGNGDDVTEDVKSILGIVDNPVFIKL